MQIKMQLTPFALRSMKVRGACVRAFNTSARTVDEWAESCRDTQIICSAEQFAKFIIYRCEAGGQNSIKDLRAIVFTPTHDVINVSQRGSN